jgi:hypothetical protein
MNEFVTVSSSSYDPASLATKLTEKSAQGWEIVAIVPTGGDVTAFLSRESTGAASDSAGMMASEDTSSAPAAAAMPEAAPAMAEAAPSEPAGWAVAPDPAPTSSAPATVIQTSSPMASMDTSSSAPNYSSAPAAAAPAPTPTPAVPAGWYADPAGRFDLRYWDGGTWTEHVSRAGQQFTDAPVA